MSKFWLIVAAAAGLTAASPAADKMANFTGTWVRDPVHSESRQEPHDTGITSVLPGITGTQKGGNSPGIGAADPRSVSNPDDVNRSFDELAGEWMGSLTLVIVQTDGELQTTRRFFTIDGTEKSVTQKFALDGSRCLNLASDNRGEFESRTVWRGDKLINSGTQTVATRQKKIEILVTEEYSISKDGKKLTIKTKELTPQGATMNRQVFNKRKGD